MIVHPWLADYIVEEREDGYAASRNGKLFMASESVAEDGKRWLHASISKKNGQMPSYHDLKQLKYLIMGAHRTALQVFPPADKHVDFAGKHGIEVLHLWCCLDGDVTPDFSGVFAGERMI